MSRSKVKVTGDKKNEKVGIFGESSSGAPSCVALLASAATPVGESAHAVCFSICRCVLVLFAYCCVRFGSFITMPRDWLWRTSPKWSILCWVGRKTWTQSTEPARAVSGPPWCVVDVWSELISVSTCKKCACRVATRCPAWQCRRLFSSWSRSSSKIRWCSSSSVDRLLTYCFCLCTATVSCICSFHFLESRKLMRLWKWCLFVCPCASRRCK